MLESFLAESDPAAPRIATRARTTSSDLLPPSACRQWRKERTGSRLSTTTSVGPALPLHIHPQLLSARMPLRIFWRFHARMPLLTGHHPALSRQDIGSAARPHRYPRRSA